MRISLFKGCVIGQLNLITGSFYFIIVASLFLAKLYFQVSRQKPDTITSSKYTCYSSVLSDLLGWIKKGDMMVSLVPRTVCPNIEVSWVIAREWFQFLVALLWIPISASV